MSRSRLNAAINKVLLDEKRYAAGLQERGDFGLAKLALAALAEIKAALKSVEPGDDESYARRLEEALAERRAEYLELWDDPDGIGTSTFARVIDLVEGED